MKKNLFKILAILILLVSMTGCSILEKREAEKRKELLTANDEMPVLKEVFADYFPIGAAIPYNMLKSTQEVKVLAKHFNSITCENEMKPIKTQPSQNMFTFGESQKMTDFAIENDMRIVGHVLVWYQQFPLWIFKDGNKFLDPEAPESKELIETRLKAHIEKVVRYYEDQDHAIERWDVVNEAILETDEGGYRQCYWTDYLGPEFIATSFRYAHEADMMDGKKDLRLFYNDYNTYDPKKRQYIYEMLKGLIEDGVPIDGMGMQVHIGLEYPKVSDIAETIDLFASLGLDIEVTEIDVDIYDIIKEEQPFMTEALDISIGWRYADLFDMLKSKKDVLTGVTLWGFTDGWTWLNLKQFKPKVPAYPLPFDRVLNPKWAYWGMVDPSKLPPREEGILFQEQ